MKRNTNNKIAERERERERDEPLWALEAMSH